MKRKITKATVTHAKKVLELYEVQKNTCIYGLTSQLNSCGNNCKIWHKCHLD